MITDLLRNRYKLSLKTSYPSSLCHHSATTHTDLQLRAREKGIPVRVIHNASVMNAIGASGLQLYRFGEAVSICFFTDTWRPDSFYDKLVGNRKLGLHSLCLLDIKVSGKDDGAKRVELCCLKYCLLHARVSGKRHLP